MVCDTKSYYGHSWNTKKEGRKRSYGNLLSAVRVACASPANAGLCRGRPTWLIAIPIHEVYRISATGKFRRAKCFWFRSVVCPILSVRLLSFSFQRGNSCRQSRQTNGSFRRWRCSSPFSSRTEALSETIMAGYRISQLCRRNSKRTGEHLGYKRCVDRTHRRANHRTGIIEYRQLVLP